MVACLGDLEGDVNDAKDLADVAKGSYDGAVDSLRSIDSSSFSTRADFDAAKNAGIDSTKSALTSYISGIDGVNSVASAIGILSAVAMDTLAVLTTLANEGILGLIPGPGTPSVPAIIIAKAWEDALQCGGFPDLPPDPPEIIPDLP